MLTDRQLLVIKLSWSYISSRLDDFGDLFYKILFQVDPGLKGLFKNDIELQRRKFAVMMNHVVSNIQQLEKLEEQLTEIGKKHEEYGVASAHYDTVTLAFLLALKKILKSHYNDETRDAWAVALNIISYKMKNYRTVVK